VCLLTVPTHSARLLCIGRGQLNRHIRYDIRRVLGRKRQAEQAQVELFRKLVQMHALAMFGFGIAPTQLSERLMDLLSSQTKRFALFHTKAGVMRS